MKNTSISRILIFLTLTFLSLNSWSQTNLENEYKPATQSETTIKNIHLIKNIRYGAIPKIAEDSISDRLLDLYVPEPIKAKTPLPVIVFIHGGGFTGGDKGLSELCVNLASEGFAVASINYTLVLKYKKAEGTSCTANMSKGLPKNGFHPLLIEAIQTASADAVLALSWIKNNAKLYNLDLNRVAISGGSAGSMTALYTTYVSNQKVIKIKAVVDLWGGLEDVNLIKKGAAPVLIYHGDLDKLINVDFAYALKKRMDKIGSTNSEIHILEGKGHAQYKYITENKIKEITTFLKANL
jgi:para-nitrobenzyl esterase